MGSYVRVYIPGTEIWYSFTGVVSVKHNFSLKLSSEPASSGQNSITGTRNNPNKLILNVVESDTCHQQGWAARMLQAMQAIKNNKTFCTIVTKMFTYYNMVLSELSVTEDEENSDGWSGSLTFVESVNDYSTAAQSVNNNSSTASNSGNTGKVVIVSGSPLQQMLSSAGISI